MGRMFRADLRSDTVTKPSAAMRRAMADADLTIVVLDASGAMTAEDDALVAKAESQGRHLVVANKADQPVGEGYERALKVSALTGEGIEELRRAIVRSVCPQGQFEQDGGFITSLRQEQLLRESHEALAKARMAAWAPGPGVLASDPPGARTFMCMAVIPLSLATEAASAAARMAA